MSPEGCADHSITEGMFSPLATAFEVFDLGWFFIAAIRHRMRATHGLFCLRIAYLCAWATCKRHIDSGEGGTKKKYKRNQTFAFYKLYAVTNAKHIASPLYPARCVTRNHPEMKCIFNDIQFTVIAAALPQWHQWYDDRRSQRWCHLSILQVLAYLSPNVLFMRNAIFPCEIINFTSAGIKS